MIAALRSYNIKTVIAAAFAATIVRFVVVVFLWPSPFVVLTVTTIVAGTPLIFFSSGLLPAELSIRPLPSIMQPRKTMTKETKAKKANSDSENILFQVIISYKPAHEVALWLIAVHLIPRNTR